MRLYLAGPIAGCPDWNRPVFAHAAARLRVAGYDVVNPTELIDDPALPSEHHMRRDIKALMDCDAVAVLPGWNDSRGARLEVDIALALGMRVLRVDGWVGW